MRSTCLDKIRDNLSVALADKNMAKREVATMIQVRIAMLHRPQQCLLHSFLVRVTCYVGTES